MKLLIRRLSRDLHVSEEEVLRRLELVARDAARVNKDGGVTTEQMGNALKRMAAAYNSTPTKPLIKPPSGSAPGP